MFLFIAGIVVGIAWHKAYIHSFIRRIDYIACSYCEFKTKRDELEFYGRKKK